MMQNPLVSIIVPVYNVYDFFTECCNSILAQTYTNLEVILVDDGSTDGSGDLCDTFAKKDNRVVVIHKENGGQSSARNEGLKIAKGDYIGFVDSDDIPKPDMIKVLVEGCLKTGCPLGCINFSEYDGKNETKMITESSLISNKEYSVLTSKELLSYIANPDAPYYISYCVWSKLYRKDIIHDLWFPNGMVYEEIAFNTKAVIRARKAIYINRSHYLYRNRSNSTTRNTNRNKFVEELLRDWKPQVSRQIHFFEMKGWQDVANVNKAFNYMNLLYCEYLNKEPRFRAVIKKGLRNWRLNAREIAALPYSNKNKIIVALKMYMPFVFVIYYHFEANKKYSFAE